MHTEHVLRDPPVVVRVHLVKDNEDHVKTREEGVLHANVVHRRLVLIVLQKIVRVHHYTGGMFIT